MTQPQPTPAAGGRSPIGEPRNPTTVALLSLVTCGIYGLYWAYLTFEELKQHNGEGLGGGLGALLSWLVYNGVGIQKHGFVGYFKLQSVPAGVKGPILALLIPLEFLSNILVRPITLALRLFCNMFAGHLLLILFALGGEHLVELGGAYIGVGVLAWVLFIAVAFLEILIQFLQAYVFVLLNAMYISGALADEH